MPRDPASRVSPVTVSPVAPGRSPRPTARRASRRAARLSPSTSTPVEIFGSDDSELLITGEAVALDRRTAGFVLRGAGAAIDVAVVVLLAIGLAMLLSNDSVGRALDDSTLAALGITLVVLLTVVLPTAVETLSHGKSLGKLAVGVRVVREDGGSIGFRHAFIRALVGLLEVFGTLGGLAAIVALLNPRARRIGDILAGTYARNERVPVRAEAIVEVPATLSVWAETADVARLPDPLARRLAAFHNQSAAMQPATRSRLAAGLVAETVPYVSSLPADLPPSAYPGAEDLLRAITALRRDRYARSLRLTQERLSRVEPTLSALPHAFPDRG